MIHNVVIEPKYGLASLSLYIDGVDIADKVTAVDIKIEAGETPQMILTCPIQRIEINELEMNVEGLNDG